MPDRFYADAKAVKDEPSGRIFTGDSHHDARDAMERAMGRRQPGTEGYLTPDGFVSKSEMHGHRDDP